MSYDEFKEKIENTNLTSEEFYNSLLDVELKDTLEVFYNRYIKEEVDDDVSKYNKIEYYLDIVDIFKNKQLELYNVNAAKQYMNFVGLIKILPKNEKDELLKEVCELRKQLIIDNITKESITEELKKINVEIEYFNKKDLSDKIRYLKSINANEKIIEHLNRYCIYEDKSEKYLEQNLKLVIKLAKMTALKIGNLGTLDINDLIQEGNIGLRKALDKFEIERERQFSTYAYFWIMQSITIGIGEKSRSIRVPIHVYEAYHKMIKIENQFRLEKNRKPTIEEIAEKLGLRVERINEIRAVERKILSFDQPLSSTEDSDLTLGDAISDPLNSIEDNINAYSDYVEMKNNLYSSSLTDKEIIIIVLRRGLGLGRYVNIENFIEVLNEIYPSEKIIGEYNKLKDDYREKTLEEIGKLFDVTRERIRQIESDAKEKLKKRILLNRKLKGGE